MPVCLLKVPTFPFKFYFILFLLCFRGNLYRDVIDNLQEARHKAAEEVRKLKEKLDMPSSGKTNQTPDITLYQIHNFSAAENPKLSVIKGDESHRIQSENLNLNKAVSSVG